MANVSSTFICAVWLATSICAAEPSEDAAKIVAVVHLKKWQAQLERGNLEPAEKEFDLAIISYPDGAALYGMRGKTRYERKNYPGAIEDFDIYLKAKPEDTSTLLLRGIAKSLLKPEDIVGACSDFLVVQPHMKGVDMGKYCHGQAGWSK